MLCCVVLCYASPLYLLLLIYRCIWFGRYCWCLPDCWSRVDILGVVCVCRWDRVWVVLCCVVLYCASSFYLEFVDSSFCSDYGVG